MYYYLWINKLRKNNLDPLSFRVFLRNTITFWKKEASIFPPPKLPLNQPPVATLSPSLCVHKFELVTNRFMLKQSTASNSSIDQIDVTCLEFPRRSVRNSHGSLWHHDLALVTQEHRHFLWWKRRFKYCGGTTTADTTTTATVLFVHREEGRKDEKEGAISGERRGYRSESMEGDRVCFEL